LKLSILIPWKDQQIEVWTLPNHIPDCNPKGIQYRMYCECSKCMKNNGSQNDVVSTWLQSHWTQERYQGVACLGPLPQL
jgi:hypothetical protein